MSVSVQKENLSRIISVIEEDASREVERILGEARAKAEELKKAAEQEAQERREEILKRGRREAERERARIIASARLKAKKQMLDAKEEAIQKVFSEVRKALEEISKDRKKYREVLKKLVAEAAESIGGDAVIICREQDRRIFSKRFLSELEKLTGVKLELAEETTGGSGGVILRSRDGRTEVDNTFETRLERAMAELRNEAAGLLFGQVGE